MAYVDWMIRLARSALAAAVLILLLGPAPAVALYVQLDIATVPVDRLIANLERALAAPDVPTGSAKRLELKARLARVHALAYAQGAPALEVVRKTGKLFEGYGFVPAIPRRSGPKPAEHSSQAHLAQALELYRAVLSERPGQVLTRIGYAWSLEASGAKLRAIDEYRAVVAAAWPKDKDVASLEHGALTLTQEAAGRLVRLLDAQDDAAEIAELRRRERHFDQIPRWITPLVVPLEDGLSLAQLFDRTAAVRFDLDGSGLARRWRWITPRAAWLVWDPNGTGAVTSGLQLFGAVTFWLFWEQGYAALAALDDDGDGRLAGAELAGLALWRDADGDGLSDPGEVAPLADWGIAALGLDHQRHPAGFPYSPNGVIYKDGRRRPSYDWIVPSAPAPRQSW